RFYVQMLRPSRIFALLSNLSKESIEYLVCLDRAIDLRNPVSRYISGYSTKKILETRFLASHASVTESRKQRGFGPAKHCD
ncbi:hypothetical protein, partial [Microcoleus sp. herbarium12]|uniref:hypothetical protein n=1 Tax=Microcoleus sp. herbarium12 TaxID=3055437 RepID=UPI002FD1895A